MKKSNLLFLAIISLVLMTGTKSEFMLGNHCLEMNGFVKFTGFDEEELILDSAMVVITNTIDKNSDTLFTDEFGHCNFELELNSQFYVFISKNQFVGKTLFIDTRLYGKREKHFTFPFDMILFRKVDGIDITQLLNDPIACLIYDNTNEYFEYNYNYSDYINEKIRKIYASHYQSGFSVDSTIKNSAFPITEIVNVCNSNIPGGQVCNSEVVFKVQIVAVVFGPLPDDHPVFRDYNRESISVTFSNGLYRYFIGDFMDRGSAERKLTEVKQNGFEDAFITAFKDGKEFFLEKTN